MASKYAHHYSTGYTVETNKFKPIRLSGSTKIDASSKYVINVDTNIIYRDYDDMYVVYGRREYDVSAGKYKIYLY